MGNPVVNLVIVYAPTELAEKQEKDNFYATLANFIQDIPPHNMLILLGDFNARMSCQHFKGVDSYNYEAKCIGQFLYHRETNDNGQRLLELCQTSNLSDI